MENLPQESPASQQTDLAQASPLKPRFAYKKTAIIIVIALLVAAGGYFGYKFYGVPGMASLKTANEQTVWENFQKAQLPNIYSAKYQLDFAGKYINGRNGYSTYKDFSAQYSGEIDANFSAQPTAIKTHYFFTSNGDGEIFSSNIDKISVNGEHYVKRDTPGLLPKDKWVKVDEKTAERAEFLSYSEVHPLLHTPVEIENIGVPAVLRKIWGEPQFIELKSFVGRENLNGHTVYHYKIALNKDAVKNAYEQWYNERSAENVPESIRESFGETEELSKARVDGSVFRVMDVWINPESSQLEKLEVDADIPDYQMLYAEYFAKVKSAGDWQRMADMSEISNKLELSKYMGGYPEAADGKPADLTNFNNQFPKAPPAGGTCTDYFNTYWYAPAGAVSMKDGKKVYESYSLTFCLAEGLKNFKNFGNGQLADYAPGVARLTPAGVESGITCPGKPEQCQGPEHPKVTLSQVAADPLVHMKYKLTLEYSGIGEEKQVAPPAEFEDFSR